MVAELHDDVVAHLQKYGVQYTVLPCEDKYADTAAFCEHYGYTPEQSANTILVATRNEPVKIAACLLLASTKLDVNKTVKQRLGGGRVSFASAEQTIAATGMQLGGVTVFGLPESMPLYIDAAVMEQVQVVMGGGNRTTKLLLSPQELLKLPHAEVVANMALPR